MAQSVRISDDLYALAQKASQALSRPLAQQMEYWARLGAALDAAGISAAAAMQLLGNGASADEFVQAAMGRGAPADGGLPRLKEVHQKDVEDVKAGRRSSRSLWAVQAGGLKGYTFTPSATSEFDRVGNGW